MLPTQVSPRPPSVETFADYSAWATIEYSLVEVISRLTVGAGTNVVKLPTMWHATLMPAGVDRKDDPIDAAIFVLTAEIAALMDGVQHLCVDDLELLLVRRC